MRDRSYITIDTRKKPVKKTRVFFESGGGDNYHSISGRLGRDIDGPMAAGGNYATGGKNVT